MQPDHITWDDFTARQAAPEAGEETAGQPKLARKKRRSPRSRLC
jgi:hypothetical protein